MADLHSAIHIENGYEHNAVTYYPVLIIGAGAAGIALGCQLKEQLGFDQFRIFDRQAGLGGTWWINRYPGVAVDIPAIFYSFSFAPNNRWTTFFPNGSEIINYFHDVCNKYQIQDKIQLNTDVTGLKWLENEKLWEATLVHMAHGTGDLSAKDRRDRIEKNGEQSVYLWRETVRAKIVASCVGGLVEPKDWPDHISGRESFEGDIFHSARWNYDVDLTNKDIIILGTGCSAAQFSTRLTKPPYNAKSVTHLMRSPPWVIPKPLPPFGPEVWGKWSAPLFDRVPGVGRFFRTFVYVLSELDYYTIFHNTPANQRARKRIEAQLIADMKSKVPEKYHEILTPDYGVGCKRRIFDEYWFKEMDDPKYNLTTQPLRSVQARSVTLGPGRTYPPMSKTDSKAPTEEVTLPADVIILANGFDLTTWLHPLHVRGRGGKVLQEEWDARGGPQAYMGTAMDGFPNFFIIFGPNTATGHSSVILAIENMVNYSLKFMKPLLKGEMDAIEVKRNAEEKWTGAIQEELKDTVWMTGGCHSWYFRADGWNATAYPRSQTDFTLRCMFPKWSDWNVTYTTRGLLMRRVRQSLKYAAFAAALIGVYQLRKQGTDIASVLQGLKVSLNDAMLTATRVLSSRLKRVQG